MILVGVDGCRGGWLAVSQPGQRRPDAKVSRTFAELIGRFPETAIIAVDMPIGLPDAGSRQCDVDARRYLGRPRSSSVFPAPLRACLAAGAYEEACSIRFEVEGKRMSQQAFGILGKIREVDAVLRKDQSLAARVVEVHPEASFALMNDGRPMQHGKKTAAGRQERLALIEAQWPGALDDTRSALHGQDFGPDDLHDAFAALWSARRWAVAAARVFGGSEDRDAQRLPMRIVG